jgi:hypothetical protein
MIRVERVSGFLGLFFGSKFYKGEVTKNYIQTIVPSEAISGRAAKRR